jgi:hypothetical protein
MPDETPDREDTPEREAEKREAQEKDTEAATPAGDDGPESETEEGLLGGTPGHIPARSD